MVECERCMDTGGIVIYTLGDHKRLNCPDCHKRKWEPKDFNEKPNVLERAGKLVKERGKSYNNPYDNFSRTAMIWSAILGITVTPDQVAKMLIGLKLARLSQTPDHQDSIDDIVGYGWCLDETIKRTKELLKCDTDQSLTQSKRSNSQKKI